MYDITAQAPGSAKLVALNCVNVDASAGVHVVASACVDVDIARNERSLNCVAESSRRRWRLNSFRVYNY